MRQNTQSQKTTNDYNALKMRKVKCYYQERFDTHQTSKNVENIIQNGNYPILNFVCLNNILKLGV